MANTYEKKSRQLTQVKVKMQVGLSVYIFGVADIETHAAFPGSSNLLDYIASKQLMRELCSVYEITYDLILATLKIPTDATKVSSSLTF